MRRKKSMPVQDDRRAVTKYAFLPITLGEDWVWLEWVYIEQRYVIIHQGKYHEPVKGIWIDWRFIDEAEYLQQSGENKN